METLHIVTLHVITVSSWIKHGMIFNCEEILLKRAAKDVERTSAKLQRNPRWNDRFNGQLFSKVTWKYVLYMNIYHILICSSLVVTLLRTSSTECLIYMCMIQRTRVSAPLLPFRINVVPLGNTAAGRRYMYGKKKPGQVVLLGRPPRADAHWGQGGDVKAICLGLYTLAMLIPTDRCECKREWQAPLIPLWVSSHPYWDASKTGVNRHQPIRHFKRDFFFFHFLSTHHLLLMSRYHSLFNLLEWLKARLFMWVISDQ